MRGVQEEQSYPVHQRWSELYACDLYCPTFSGDRAGNWGEMERIVELFSAPSLFSGSFMHFVLIPFCLALSLSPSVALSSSLLCWVSHSIFSIQSCILTHTHTCAHDTHTIRHTQKCVC